MSTYIENTMEDIGIPETDKETVSTRIDTVAHDILKKLSVTKYGSKSHMSSVLTDAVRFIYDPTPTQRVAQQKFLNNIEVHARDPECSESKVIHWTAPTELAEEMKSLGANNRDFIESAIYEYESAYATMDEKFSPESMSSEQVVDWDVLQENYSVQQDIPDIEGADVPSKPNKRRPFLLSLISPNGISGFDVFTDHYFDRIEEEYDVSGLPSTRKTRRNDWDALIENKYLIPTPVEKAERPIETVDSDGEAYYLRRNLDDGENRLTDVLEDYLTDMEGWMRSKARKSVTYDATDAVYQQRENTLSVITGYDEIKELEEYAERAGELQMEMFKELVEIPA